MDNIVQMMMGAAGASAGGINPREYFNTVLWTGNNTANRSITGVGFQPDFVWLKSRSSASWNHFLQDAVRGADKFLISASTNAEGTTSPNIVTSFNSDGFVIENNGNSNTLNDTYVAWNWKANGAGVSNTAGTISSTVSVSTTSGFSIVTYTGTGANATVGHGLGVQPSMVIVKNRDNGAAGWYVEHIKLTGFGTYTIFLNQTSAESANSTHWNNTAPTSSVFSVGTSGGTNESGSSHVAYCFAEVEGFSKFGSYTGNGSATGPSVTTDFEPTWLMIKRTDQTGDWIILDSARDTANPRDKFLEPNTADAEATGNDVDFNSTGFQLKSTSASINASGGTYIYACFA